MGDGPVPLGFSRQRLERIPAFIESYVDDGKLPGYVCLVSRFGEEAYYTAYGCSDVERGTPIARNTIFRIYSMTKPITSVALMTLYEKGAFQLDDPVANYLPQWRDLHVFAGGDATNYHVQKPSRPMVIKDLFTHTSGLTYGFLNTHPVDAMYRAAQIAAKGPGSTLAGMIDDLAALPLQFSPGTQWNYSVSTDVLGHLVQVFSDQDLGQYIAERITRPLGMDDTGFFVMPKNHARLAACYDRVVATNSLKLQDNPRTSPYLKLPTFLSGGGGLVSTVDDYHTFARMLLGKGEANGVRVLGRKTVEYMTVNHLPGNKDIAAMGRPIFSETSYDGIGFGLGFSVVLDPATANVVDSAGDFAWGGAASTYFWIDPVEQLIVIFMSQLLPSSSYPIRRQLKALVYQALVD
jgi:CubicO group peptidase (beta-lactamase class C family)